MGINWPHGGDPSPYPPSLVDDIVSNTIEIFRLLELPEPHVTVLTMVFHVLLFFVAWFWITFMFIVIRQSVFLTLFRSLSGTESRHDPVPEPWDVTLLRLLNPHNYDNIVGLAAGMTTFTVSLFLLTVAVAASDSWTGALVWVLLWAGWLYVGWRYCQPMKSRYTREDVRLWAGNGVWFHAILLIAALAYFPALIRQMDNGIVRLNEILDTASPPFLKDMATEIIFRHNPPQYRMLAPEDRMENNVWN
ncbi:uncharacterized protein F4812DRAFT_470728 [Daldinia caldariorum]|uniref:uncharacterized protein n=1 Tax=Daldinia caldariorum TaxID=326644 RepID=UPI0020086D3B|nr:uncharacterized protein F4812DRAFT_470728 [Daldinia caldariorum]KAI1468990.1 hypothetical protein F4812DRAFT_470728 [Daldinia caldariorum]